MCCLQHNHKILKLKYIPGKEVALADTCQQRQPSRWDRHKRVLISLLHEVTQCMTPNTDVNDMCWTEAGCNNAVTDPRVCFKGGPRYCKEMDPALYKYWTLRHDLSIENGCIAYLGKLFHLTYGNSVWSHCIEVFQGCLRCVLKQNRAYTGWGINQVENCIPCQVIARSQ